MEGSVTFEQVGIFNISEKLYSFNLLIFEVKYEWKYVRQRYEYKKKPTLTCKHETLVGLGQLADHIVDVTEQGQLRGLEQGVKDRFGWPGGRDPGSERRAQAGHVARRLFVSVVPQHWAERTKRHALL